MKSLKSYSPGPHKLMHHLDHLAKIRDGKVVAPLHVSVWPTIRCQCSCAYCCCRNEDRSQPDLEWRDYAVAVSALEARGTRAIEFAGGGEPLLWPYFSDAVIYAKNRGLKVSLVTNGLDLQGIDRSVLLELAWIRVSLQSVEHARRVELGCVPSKVPVSVSVIYDRGIDFTELHGFVEARNIMTRIAVSQPSRAQDREDASRLVARMGLPFFFAEKPDGAPAGCYMAWIRAAIDWTGHFLPCPSVMLADSDGVVKDAFRICHARNLGKWLNANPARDLGFRCALCNCGKENNDLVHKIFERVEHDDFV